MKSLSKVYKHVELLRSSFPVGPKDEPSRHVGEERSLPSLEELTELREMVLREAQREAQRILEQARSEEEAIRRRAEEEGRRKGENEAREALRRAWEERVVILEGWVKELRKVRELNWQALKEPLLNLVFALAEKVIGREAERAPFVEETIVRALLRLSQRERVVIRVNPEEYLLVRDLKDDLFRRIEGLEFVEVKEDPRIRRGGCIVETQFGNVDARLETQIAVLREEVARVLEEGEHV